MSLWKNVVESAKKGVVFTELMFALSGSATIPAVTTGATALIIAAGTENAEAQARRTGSVRNMPPAAAFRGERRHIRQGNEILLYVGIGQPRYFDPAYGWANVINGWCHWPLPVGYGAAYANISRADRFPIGYGRQEPCNPFQACDNGGGRSTVIDEYLVEQLRAGKEAELELAYQRGRADAGRPERSAERPAEPVRETPREETRPDVAPVPEDRAKTVHKFPYDKCIARNQVPAVTTSYLNDFYAAAGINNTTAYIEGEGKKQYVQVLTLGNNLYAVRLDQFQAAPYHSMDALESFLFDTASGHHGVDPNKVLKTEHVRYNAKGCPVELTR